MTILIDSRERKAAFTQSQLRNWGIPSEILALSSADYMFPRLSLGIERKAVPDLQSNFAHLPNQLLRCKEQYRNVMLLIEGRWSFDEQSGMMFRHERGEKIPLGLRQRSFQNLLLSLQFYHGIYLFYTNDFTDTLLFLRNLHELSEKPYHRILDFDGSNEMAVANLYSSLPGIGEQLARRVQEAHPVPPISSDFADKLEGIRGINDSKIEQVRSFLRGDWLVKQSELPSESEGELVWSKPSEKQGKKRRGLL